MFNTHARINVIADNVFFFFLIFQISFDGIYANMRMVHILTSVVVSYHIIGEKLPWSRIK